MTNGPLNINNLTTGRLSLDLDFGGRKTVRELLQPVGQPRSSFDVSDIASEDDLNAHPRIQQLLAAPAKISITGGRGTTDVPGSSRTSIVDANGMATGNPRVRVTWIAGAAGARDIPIYVGNFPFAARVLDSQIMVSTAVAGTAQLRDAAAGAGNTLSAAMSTTAAGRVRDPGTGQTGGSGVLPTLARNASLYLRLTAGDTAGSAIIEFERIS